MILNLSEHQQLGSNFITYFLVTYSICSVLTKDILILYINEPTLRIKDLYLKEKLELYNRETIVVQPHIIDYKQLE